MRVTERLTPSESPLCGQVADVNDPADTLSVVGLGTAPLWDEISSASRHLGASVSSAATAHSDGSRVLAKRLGRAAAIAP